MNIIQHNHNVALRAIFRSAKMVNNLADCSGIFLDLKLLTGSSPLMHNLLAFYSEMGRRYGISGAERLILNPDQVFVSLLSSLQHYCYLRGIIAGAHLQTGPCRWLLRAQKRLALVDKQIEALPFHNRNPAISLSQYLDGFSSPGAATAGQHVK